jgi:predicted O-linked N-acetylglucosamine transferase (SPINDLY family)
VITLAGELHAGRVGLSLLSRLGLDELIARTEHDYIRTACSLAGNPGQLNVFSHSLRSSVETNLCNRKQVVDEAEVVFRQVWRQWCSAE